MGQELSRIEVRLPLEVEQLLHIADQHGHGFPPVLLAGSWVERRGCPGADVDLYLFPQHEAGATPPPAIIQTQVGNQKVDIEVWPQVAVRQVIARFEGVDPRREHSLPPISFKERLLLDSLRIGIPLRGAGFVAEARERLERSAFVTLEVVRRYREWLRSRETIMEAVQGGYPIAALVELEAAVHLVADAYLIAHGDTNPHKRWIHERFSKLGPAVDGFRRRFLAFRFPGVDPDNPEAAAEVVRAGVEFVGETYDHLLRQMGLGDGFLAQARG